MYQGLARDLDSTGQMGPVLGLGATDAAPATPHASQSGSRRSPWQTAPKERRASRPHEAVAVPCPRHQVSCRRSPSSSAPALLSPSRGAVTGATSRAGKSPQGSQTPSAASGLTAAAADNPSPSAGQAQACLADIPALLAVAPHPTSAGASTTNHSSLTAASTASPALAPRALADAFAAHALQLQPGTRPVDPTLTGRGRAGLPGAEPHPTDAARIAASCSATATPGTCREGEARSGTAPSRGAVIGATSRADKSPQGSQTPCGLTATAAHNRPPSAGPGAARLADTPASLFRPATHLSGTATNAWSLTHLPLSAVSAHDVSQRAPLASAGSSDARTQGGPRSSATWADRGQSIAPTRRRQRRAGVNGVGTTHLRLTTSATSPLRGRGTSAVLPTTGER